MNLIYLPPIIKISYSTNNNFITQHFGKEETINNCELVSTSPFILKSNGREYYFTNSESEEIPEIYEYALLSSKKLVRKDFRSNNLKIKKWLRNPALQDTDPSSVITSWSGKFKVVKEDPAIRKPGLRSPQVGALYSILAHLQNAEEIGIVVMPTGTGKTETMLCSLIANQCEKLLVAVPSDSLRGQLSEKFMTLGLLKEFGVIDGEAQNPIVGVMNSKIEELSELEEFISKSNVVVTTMSILTGLSASSRSLLSRKFSHLFIDEAHHSQASTWKDFIRFFDKGKVFLFTATPYRNDGKKLDGKFIFSFSLKKAQEQKYYKKINYLPIREYDKRRADEAIAEKAVQQLRTDLLNGFHHILMARCRTKERAKEVFEYYSMHEDLNPVLVYTGIGGLSQRISAIKNKEHKIVICVDMLGEGFDLPELKIAAVHDERQSLPITLQFIGRFTRSSYDQLGEASFITNLAYPPIKEELDQLYAKDSDWNLLLPTMSEGATQKEIDFKDFLDGFGKLEESIIPFQNIVPALSTVVYKSDTEEWSPRNWKEGVSNIDSYDHQFADHNSESNTLVIILGKVSKVDWGDFDVVQNVDWELIVVFWEYTPDSNRIFINTSMKGLATEKLVKSIFSGESTKICGMDVFKIFHEVHRLSLYNVGARRGVGRDITFQSYFGRGVQDGLQLLEQGTLVKNNIFGVGYKNGEKVSLGCSVKGKIWSHSRGNLQELTQWCSTIGEIVENPDIDPNAVLQQTLVPISISQAPDVTPIAIEWHPEMYMYSEDKYEMLLNGKPFFLFNSELSVDDLSPTGELRFKVDTDGESVGFEMHLGLRTVAGMQEPYFEVKKTDNIPARILYRGRDEALVDFFQVYTPTFWFADGSQLFQNRYVKLRDRVGHIPLENIHTDTWAGVNLRKESQGISPYEQDSIQYYFIDKIKNDFDVVYDDDGSGEIADIVAINDYERHMDVHLYHLKYAKGGRVGNDIDNFYQVCGQAQKSLNWKHREGRHFFDHLLRRNEKTESGNTCSRLVKGSEDQLGTLLNAAKWTKEMRFHIYIVQPSLSKAGASESILLLLGNTHHYLHTVGNVKLNVICSQ
ncbi:DEAD/DEAH box helicase [Pontibacter silvestris]|uniref:DEAD/DEAH box helicase n=1 Tax=Pontibacter silvestris TaxID=2305183 RepID=A0ABW4WZH2_9BACT|nr:DEAD/DEAH box helicase family protein [Pontibacter silvestris]MCC9138704.1 DEAD/DEAH box helicase family protein [Pontibacter silvestris]